jgi:hypothetical protein
MEDPRQATYDPAADEPRPTPTDGEDVQSLVIADVEARRRVGVERYGTPLQAFNGRRVMRDVYDEALDLTCYLRQRLAEDEVATELAAIVTRFVSTQDLMLYESDRGMSSTAWRLIQDAQVERNQDLGVACAHDRCYTAPAIGSDRCHWHGTYAGGGG